VCTVKRTFQTLATTSAVVTFVCFFHHLLLYLQKNTVTMPRDDEFMHHTW